MTADQSAVAREPFARDVCQEQCAGIGEPPCWWMAQNYHELPAWEPCSFCEAGAAIAARAHQAGRREGLEEAEAALTKEIERLEQLRLNDDGGNGGYVGVWHRLLNVRTTLLARAALPVSAQPEEAQ